MAKLVKFGIMRQNFCELADFVTVYIAEAHPAEKQHLTHNLRVGTHKSLEDRIAAAQKLADMAGHHLGPNIMVDPMDDRTNHAYSALPERLYVVLDGKVVFEGGMGPFHYRIDLVEEFLSKRM